mmetsp:Transcript_12232/g.37320  ORF Transcript_12232/g.37320 Transcript_12232/m.37320 type:complete len:289 (-) Transcript_12232:1929-2795(-)|eukprot:CAMPEP_0198733488 /NCGR_PEP_ID=MMETSP1475-20131203/46117_1 /TAXON_ID= ORGANISM="Unidentified sp., Strain CCMP1999" /NCGR_SAMPLE_ID=MMETSP1475 /ASSEMBLY_ACC=CAM_ASM_001111 /LENGTH=288 /DNA_ID=CAMNT_0044496795 /DNA_START=76 /DNA_END=942 /DNA_ORIENTATION=-
MEVQLRAEAKAAAAATQGAELERADLQVGGHADSFKADKEEHLLKAYSEEEWQIYKNMQDDRISEVVPGLFGVVEEEGKQWLSMENLCFDMRKPVMMDIKIGRRTFRDSEHDNQRPRMDLLEKMLKISATEATQEERRIGITKQRYMTFRDDVSSSSTLSFRVEGIKKLKGDKLDVNFKAVREPNDVSRCVQFFLDGDEGLCRRFLAKMGELRQVLEQSQMFSQHEFIGSSLLFVYDQSMPSQMHLRMIDFAKTNKLPGLGCAFDRNDYIVGLDNLTRLWQLQLKDCL